MSLDDLESAYGYGGSREKALAAAASLDPSDTGSHGITAVHIAAQHVDPEVLELLLSRGFRAGATDEYGRTPLHILAVQNWKDRVSKMAECTDILLAARCPPSRRDESGRCFYHIAADLHNCPMIAVIGQRRIRCDALLESSGMNALHLVCSSASRYDFHFENDPDLFDREDRMCRRMAEWLIGCGLDPEAETKIGKKAVNFAVENRIKITSAFLAGDTSVESGGMDLSQAVIMNDPAAVRAIIGSGADPDALCDREGEYRGRTPLMIACRRMASESAFALLDGGADATVTEGDSGHTALYHLIMSLSSLVGTGGNPRDSDTYVGMLRRVVEAQGSVDLPVGDREGSALCFVAGNDRLGGTSNGRSVRTLTFETLVSLGVDIESRDGEGRTPLIRACSVEGRDSEDIVCTLMEMGADCDAVDGSGMTAVMHAASLGRDGGLDLIRTIFDFCEPDLSVRGSDGRDAAELAAASDSRGVLAFILDWM